MARRTTERLADGKRSSRTAAHQKALTRTFGGLEVRDATADLRVPVAVEDVARAERKNPERCVFAMACQRHFGSTAAVFFKTYAYVDIKGEDGVRHVERFVVNGVAQQLIAQFDNDGPEGIPTDERWITLKAPSPGRRLDYNVEKNRERRKKQRQARVHQRREPLVGEIEGADDISTRNAGVSAPRSTPRELEIRNGTGLWHMIRKERNGMLGGKLSAEDVAAIRKAREDALGTPTKTYKTPRRYAPPELTASLAERYGVTRQQIKDIWGGRK